MSSPSRTTSSTTSPGLMKLTDVAKSSCELNFYPEYYVYKELCDKCGSLMCFIRTVKKIYLQDSFINLGDHHFAGASSSLFLYTLSKEPHLVALMGLQHVCTVYA